MLIIRCFLIISTESSVRTRQLFAKAKWFEILFGPQIILVLSLYTSMNIPALISKFTEILVKVYIRCKYALQILSDVLSDIRKTFKQNTALVALSVLFLLHLRDLIFLFFFSFIQTKFVFFLLISSITHRTHNSIICFRRRVFDFLFLFFSDTLVIQQHFI